MKIKNLWNHHLVIIPENELLDTQNNISSKFNCLLTWPSYAIFGILNFWGASSTPPNFRGPAFKGPRAGKIEGASSAHPNVRIWNRGSLSLNKYLGVSPKIGGKPPKWMVKIMENHGKTILIHGWFGGSFPTILGNTHLISRGRWAPTTLNSYDHLILPRFGMFQIHWQFCMLGANPAPKSGVKTNGGGRGRHRRNRQDKVPTPRDPITETENGRSPSPNVPPPQK